MHNREYIHKMPKKELFREIQKLGGLKMDNSIKIEDFEPFFPTIYSDFKLCELYEYHNDDSFKLPSKITVLWGDSDEYIQSGNISLWKNESSLPINFKKFHGGHFYIWENMLEITSFINSQIKQRENL